MFQGDSGCFQMQLETVRWSGWMHNHHWAFSVATIKSLHKISLFLFGRQTSGRSASLYIYDDNRSSVITASPIASDLSAIPDLKWT